MTIADRILCLRKKKGISQEEFSYELGVSRQAVSKWESDQSIPELDKVVLMSEYFGVTTDYLLKGIESSKKVESDNTLASKILYIASTSFIIIGLLVAFTSLNAEKQIGAIMGSIIIQVVGLAAYFIGRLISKEKPKLITDLLNIILILFLPLSLLTTYFFYGIPYPFPIGLGIIFIFIYAGIIIITYFLLKKFKK